MSYRSEQCDNPPVFLICYLLFIISTTVQYVHSSNAGSIYFTFLFFGTHSRLGCCMLSELLTSGSGTIFVLSVFTLWIPGEVNLPSYLLVFLLTAPPLIEFQLEVKHEELYGIPGKFANSKVIPTFLTLINFFLRIKQQIQTFTIVFKQF